MKKNLAFQLNRTVNYNMYQVPDHLYYFVYVEIIIKSIYDNNSTFFGEKVLYYIRMLVSTDFLVNCNYVICLKLMKLKLISRCDLPAAER